MGTSLFVSDHVYARQFDEECIGQQKVKRIQPVLNDDKLDCSIEVAYGNLPVDKPMMRLANKRYTVFGKKIILLN